MLTVYVVWEQNLAMLDSIWAKRVDAASKAETLNIYKGPIKEGCEPQWVVTEWPVQ